MFENKIRSVQNFRTFTICNQSGVQENTLSNIGHIGRSSKYRTNIEYRTELTPWNFKTYLPAKKTQTNTANTV